MSQLNQIERTSDPAEQCQYIMPLKGQCTFKAVAPGANCIIHGGNKTLEKIARLATYTRLKERYAERVKDMTNSGKQFSLLEELGILRMMLEDLLNKCGDNEHEYLRRIPQMSELLMKIEKVNNSAMRAEKYIGGLLSRPQVTTLVQNVMDSIASHISDLDILEAIARDFEVIVRKEYPMEDDK